MFPLSCSILHGATEVSYCVCDKNCVAYVFLSAGSVARSLFSTSQCQDWRWPVLYFTDLICLRTDLAFYLLFSFQLFTSCIKDDWGLGDCSNGRAVLVSLQDISSCWALMGLAIHLLDTFHQGCLNSTTNASSWMPTMRQADATTTYVSPMNVQINKA